MNRALSRLLYHIFRRLMVRDRKIHYYNAFSDTQWYSWSAMQALQLEKLKVVLDHAQRYSPYYGAVFRTVGIRPTDIRNLADLSNIPLLTKTDLRGHLDDLICTDADPRFCVRNSTSGSTGEKTVFFSDSRTAQIRAPLVRRAYEWVGIELGDRELRLWGAHFDVAKSKQLRERIFNWLNNRAVVSAYDMDDDSIAALLRHMKRFHPDYLFSYPSSIVHVCDYLKRNGASAYSPPKGILTSGEQLDSWQRELIEAHFRSKVFNFYGCREVGIIAQECDRRTGLHTIPENVIIEIIDDDGRPVPPGTTGEIVVTDLCNLVMPFIRYRIGDSGRILAGECPCGRNGLPRIAIEGRTFDIVRSPDGDAVGGTFWTLLFRSRPGIRTFQVIQDRLNEIRIDYQADTPDSIAEDTLSYFTAEIRSRLRGIHVVFNRVDVISPPLSGKQRIVISRIGREMSSI